MLTFPYVSVIYTRTFEPVIVRIFDYNSILGVLLRGFAHSQKTKRRVSRLKTLIKNTLELVRAEKAQDVIKRV